MRHAVRTTSISYRRFRESLFSGQPTSSATQSVHIAGSGLSAAVRMTVANHAGCFNTCDVASQWSLSPVPPRTCSHLQLRQASSYSVVCSCSSRKETAALHFPPARLPGCQFLAARGELHKVKRDNEDSYLKCFVRPSSTHAGMTDTSVGTANEEELKEDNETSLESLEEGEETWAPPLMQAQVVLRDRRLTLVQPRDEDEVIDMYIKQGRLDRDPYWCRIWPSAVAMAEEILAKPELVAGLRVCDLGAGLGLPGLAAALAGAREVVLFDREPLALQCALLSAHANMPSLTSNLPAYLPSLHSQQSPEGSFRTASSSSPLLLDSSPARLASLEQALPWLPSLRSAGANGGPGSAETAAEPAAGEGGPLPPAAAEGSSRLPYVRAEILDWSDLGIGDADFDVVLACDVLYEAPAVDMIANLVPRLLSQRFGSRLIVADPVERVPANRAEFIKLMEASKGMGMTSVHRRTPYLDNKTHQIELMSFEYRPP